MRRWLFPIEYSTVDPQTKTPVGPHIFTKLSFYYMMREALILAFRRRRAYFPLQGNAGLRRVAEEFAFRAGIPGLQHDEDGVRSAAGA